MNVKFVLACSKSVGGVVLAGYIISTHSPCLTSCRKSWNCQPADSADLRCEPELTGVMAGHQLLCHAHQLPAVMHSLPATRKSSQFHNGGVMLVLEIRHVSDVWQCCTYRILWRRCILIFPPCRLVIYHFMNLLKIETKLSLCQSGLFVWQLD